MATKKTTKRTTKKSPAKSSPFAREIAFVFIILLCILMLLSYFSLCGPVGEVVQTIMFGLFGISAFVFPIFLLVGAGLVLSNPTNAPIKRKVLYGAIMYISFGGILQWAINSQVKSIFDFYKISSEEHLGGGIVGGTLFYGLKSALGMAGSIVVLIGIFLVFFILLSGKMLFSSLHEMWMAGEMADKKTPKGQMTMPKEKKVKQPKEASVPNQMASYTFPKEELPVAEEEKTPKRKRRTRKQEKEEIVPIEELEKTESVTELNPVTQPVIPIHRSETPIYQEELEHKFGTEQIEPLFSERPEPVFSQVETHIVEDKNEKPEPSFSKKIDLEESKSIQVSEKPVVDYQYPSLDLLNLPKRTGKGMTDRQLMDTAAQLQSTLDSFGVKVKMGAVSCGPSVTRYELSPEQGVKVSRITGLADDIKLSLAASDIRIEAPIPGKAAVGIEVPNLEKTMVTLRELLESNEFQVAESKVSFTVGKDISGKTVVADIAKMPHMLVAGSTGSGKSVCINTLIMSILYKAHPDQVKLILIDPKQVEFGVYNDIPHLMIPVVTDPKKASAALNWAVAEMTKRYNKFSELGVRNMESYNKRISKLTNKDDENYQPLPQIVIIVDEFADLMMVAPGEVEDAVCRLAQLARAAGIHLVLATQRPSVNVITGLIKANIPSRIALSVSSSIDSRTIIDSGGAEKLLGNGDMLFAPGDLPKPVRIQGAYVSEKEVGKVVDFLKAQFTAPTYNTEVTDQIESGKLSTGGTGAGASQGSDTDELFAEVGKFIIEKDKASIGMLQRVFRIGFNRAARIMDQLADAGVVGPEEGTKPRTVLMSPEQFENYLEEIN